MQEIQQRLVGSECQLKKPYNRGAYNKVILCNSQLSEEIKK
jgi:hypothetical protein